MRRAIHVRLVTPSGKWHPIGSRQAKERVRRTVRTLRAEGGVCITCCDYLFGALKRRHQSLANTRQP